MGWFGRKNREHWIRTTAILDELMVNEPFLEGNGHYLVNGEYYSAYLMKPYRDLGLGNFQEAEEFAHSQTALETPILCDPDKPANYEPMDGWCKNGAYS